MTLNLEDKPGRGRPTKVDNDCLKTLVESDPRQTTQEMAIEMGCSDEAIRVLLHQIGKVHKQGVWIPHHLSEQNLIQRVSIASSLLACNNSERFLHRIITGDEKWVFYVNIRRTKQWTTRGQTPLPTAKPGLHPKKIMLSIWWDMSGVVYWELLEPNTTITADLYSNQLDRLKEALVKSRPSLVNRKGVILHHDNAKPHTARLTQQKIKELGWEVLPHPPYSPDIAPSDYHLFLSLSNHLMGKEYQNIEDVK